jgi:hypothetical protein
MYPITSGQESYIKDLLDIHEVSEEQKAEALARLPHLTKEQAGRWIDRLKSLPRRQTQNGSQSPNPRFNGYRVQYVEEQRAGQEPTRIGYLTQGTNPTVKIPRGSYAINTEDEPSRINDLTFFKLWIGERGGWKLYVLASDSEYPAANPVAALDKIAKDPKTAAENFGLHIGKCGICGRTLTNDESRARGIGPICAGKWGW